jgi:hypothetical protein
VSFGTIESVARDRAAVGAEVLDELLPHRRWWAGINDETLDVRSASSCVVTQVFPGHFFGENLIRLWRLVGSRHLDIVLDVEGEDEQDEAFNLGILMGVFGDSEFCQTESDDERRYWTALNVAWREEIAARLEGDNGDSADE